MASSKRLGFVIQTKLNEKQYYRFASLSILFHVMWHFQRTKAYHLICLFLLEKYRENIGEG